MGKDIIIEEEGRGGIVIYQTPDGKTNLDVKLKNETEHVDCLVTTITKIINAGE